jgi:acyl-CoA reductase-like NAD-dependent aldehyde dehydrogenase
VVGFLVPWNYPLNLALTDTIAALVAGNTAVLRPDPQTTLTALWALEQLRASGLPDDVLLVVTGEGPEIGPPLVAAVDYVMFTGSTATGRTVASGAAPRLVDVSLELGGKNPMIVCADADVDAAARAAVRLLHGCGAGLRLDGAHLRPPVDRGALPGDVHGPYSGAALLRRPAGNGDVGSLVNARQLQRSPRVDERGRGRDRACRRTRATRCGSVLLQPTILGGVTPAMMVHATETFGPVVSVYPVGGEEEAVTAANATACGLTASVWTRRGRRTGRRRAPGGRISRHRRRLRGDVGSVDAPIGGMKASGSGAGTGATGC